MRKLVSIFVLVVLSLVTTVAVTPHAKAYPQYGTETYYYHYGSSQPDDYEAALCGYYSYCNFTPEDGALKLIFTWKCDDGTYTTTWYRYNGVDCPGYTPHWELIQDPYYYHSLTPC